MALVEVKEAPRKRSLTKGSSFTQRSMKRARIARRPGIPKFPRYFADQPMRKFAKLRYSVLQTLAGPSIGNVVITEFRANGMYDPEVALGGHQPFGFDQLMAQYTHFTVIRSYCTCELQQTGDNTSVVSNLAVTSTTGVAAAAFAAAGINALNEIPQLSTSVMVAGITAKERRRRIGIGCNVLKMSGKKLSELVGNTNYSGTDSADPTEDFTFALIQYSADNTDQSAKTFPYKINIDYYAVFSEPRWFVTS